MTEPQEGDTVPFPTFELASNPEFDLRTLCQVSYWDPVAKVQVDMPENVLACAARLAKEGRYIAFGKDMSRIARAAYLKEVLALGFKPEGEEVELLTPRGSALSTGYDRIVIGDYGAYIEFSPKRLVGGSIKSKFPGTPRRKVKYLWMVPVDGSGIKVYDQKGTVEYADYVPGMLYVAPSDVTRREKSNG